VLVLSCLLACFKILIFENKFTELFSSGMLVDRGRNSMHTEIHPQGFGISSFEKKDTQVGFDQ